MDSESKHPELCLRSGIGHALFSDPLEPKDEMKNTEVSLVEKQTKMETLSPSFGGLSLSKPYDELKDKQASSLTCPQSEPIGGLKNNQDSESKPPVLCLRFGFGQALFSDPLEPKDEMKNTEGFWRPKDGLVIKQASPWTSLQSEPIGGLKNNQDVYSWGLDPALRKPSPLTSPQSEPTGGLKNNQDVYSWGLDPALRKRIRCSFCHENHDTGSCVLRHECPIDKKLFGESCFVLCACGERVVRRKCPRNCGSTWGQAYVSRLR